MTEQRAYFVYILASGPYGTLYIGVTNDLFAECRSTVKSERPVSRRSIA